MGPGHRRSGGALSARDWQLGPRKRRLEFREPAVLWVRWVARREEPIGDPAPEDCGEPGSCLLGLDGRRRKYGEDQALDLSAACPRSALTVGPSGVVCYTNACVVRVVDNVFNEWMPVSEYAILQAFSLHYRLQCLSASKLPPRRRKTSMVHGILWAKPEKCWGTWEDHTNDPAHG